ncbi:hypothetical protein C8Q75DRAFT_747823 [Abortiporus biennis]|nr:hypothetical protein C8Q75DRAFT_747823 [Abortiporus biennis]
MSAETVSIKIALLALTALFTHVATSPPNPPLQSKANVWRPTLMERSIHAVTFYIKASTWLFTLADIFVTYSAYQASLSPENLHSFMQNRLIQYFCPNILLFPTTADFDNTISSLLTVSPMLVVGSMMAIVGGSLRLWCFKTLGLMFTFEVAVLEKHKLITGGPYSIVRHPSYTGMYMIIYGTNLVCFASGSWLRTCWIPFVWTSISNGIRGVVATLKGVESGEEGFGIGGLGLGLYGFQFAIYTNFAFWCLLTVAGTRNTWKRTRKEDDELRKTFGVTWDEYAKRVRYRLIPFVM